MQNYNTLFPDGKSSLVKNNLNANGIDNLDIFGPFKHTSFKRSIITNSTFRNTALVYSAWTTSRFDNVGFTQTRIRNSNFQSAVFNSCKFENFKYSLCNSTFDFTIFQDTTFSSINFLGCNFSDTLFLNCTFENCTYSSCNFDGAKFVNCKFFNLKARNLNMDFSQFINCNFYRSKIALFQIFYSIGCFQQLSLDRSNNLAFHNSNISIDKFINKFYDELMEHYLKLNEYFPLSNLYGILGQNKELKACATEGIKNAICTKKFRLAIHFSELINFYNCLNSAEKRNIIKYINNQIKLWQQNEDINEYIKYISVIENNLLYKTNSRPVVNISVQLQEQLNPETMSDFMSFVDEEAERFKGDSGEHFITISHNSPEFINIMINVVESIAGAFIFESAKILAKKFYNWFKRRKIEVNGTVKIENTDDTEKISDLNSEDEK